MLPSSSTAALRRTNSSSQAPAPSDAIANAQNAIGRGDAHAAIRDLSARLSDQRGFHDAILSLLDSSPSQMRQELVKEAHSQRSDFDLNVHNKEGKTVLGLAVQHDDQEFARYVLGQGARPEQISLGAATPAMQTLLTSWRRKNLLYAHFNESNRHHWTPLDRALYEGRHEEVRARLEDILAKNDVHKVWEDAMHADLHDILRSLLVTGTPDELRELTMHKHVVGQWLNALRDDPGLSAVLKEFPYQSAKRGKPENHNEEVNFTGTEQIIVCRHLAACHQTQQARNPQIKFDYNKFSSPKAIARNVKPGIQKTFETLRTQASENHLIDNEKFGQFLARQFEAMEKDGQQRKLMLMASTNHVMNLGLRIKEKNGEKSYVVKFFDPNETTTGTRSKANSVKTFETQTLESYITDAGYMKTYYPELDGMSLISACTEEDAQASTSMSPASSTGKTLTSMDIKDIDSTAVWHLIIEGFFGNLRELHDHIIALPENKRIELLAAKNANGDPALFISMQEGLAKAINTYEEWLKLFEAIPQNQLIKLLAGKRTDGTPALFIGMENGQAEAIKAWGELLKQFESIPQNQLIELLAGKHANGMPSLLIAMRDGHAEAIKAWGELLKIFEIPQDKFIELLSGTTDEENLALFMSMLNGHAESVKAYGDVVKLLPPDKQADLLLAKISFDQFKGNNFQIAFENRHFSAANELLQLLAQLAPHLSPGKRAELREELKGYEKTFRDSPLATLTAPRERKKMRKLFAELKAELGQ